MTTLNPDAVVGVIGLGTMGRPMAANLLRGHGRLVVTGRTRRDDDPLIDAGATWADTPRELAERARVVLLMLPDLPQVEEVLAGPGGVLAGADGELLLIVSSSSSPTGVRELAARLDAETDGRVRVVDAPVSGGEDGATAGTLSIMVGGDPADTELAVEVLRPCGRPVVLGPLGAGQVAKACNQMVVASTILALGEASVFAERSGIDLRVLWELLGGGYAGGNLLASRVDKLVDAEYSASGVAVNMVKDLRFAEDVATATGTNPLLLPTLRAAFDELVERGHGHEDIAVTRRVIEER